MAKTHLSCEEVMRELSIREFTRLCHALDEHYGKEEVVSTNRFFNDGTTIHATRKQPVRFNIVKMHRCGNGDLLAFIDLGHGNVRWFNLGLIENTPRITEPHAELIA